MDPRSSDVDLIRQRMAQIRRKHHEEVRELIDGAQVVAGWWKHLPLYAGAVMGASAVAAAWVAAAWRPADPCRPISAAAGEVLKAAVEGSIDGEERPRPRETWIGSAARFLLNVAVRAAQSYAAYRVEQWLVNPRETSAPSPARGRAGGTSNPDGCPDDARPETRAPGRVPAETDNRRYQR